MHSRRLNVAGLVFRTRPNWNRRSKPKIPGTFHRQLVRPREQAAAHCRLLRGVRLRAAPSPRFHPAHEAERDGCFQARQQPQQVVHLHHLNEGNQRQVDGHDPESRQRLRFVHLPQLNAANGQADREQQRLPRPANRHRRNVAGRQLTIWARVRLRVRPVVPRRLHHHVRNSAPLRQ